MHVISTRPN